MASTERKTLPSRRQCETRRIQIAGMKKVFVTIGYDPSDDVTPMEIFYSGGYVSGSEIEFFMQDSCILVSILLQHGVPPSLIGRSLAQKEGYDRRQETASIIGRLIEELKVPPEWAAKIKEMRDDE